ncbi:MAG: hypothetical protein C0594_16655 [Marinilabiliales bacterium]|nr:MAG: hypothetical protein C0594_16655 [Marinilabiliales bacterium]
MKKETVIKAKRQFIADCTKNLIETAGIDSINMEDIAKASEYTKRTLYVYFKSKDEILLWVFTDDLIQRWNYQKIRIQQKIKGIDKLKEWAYAYLDYCSENSITIPLQNYMDYHFVNLEKVDNEVFSRFEEINTALAEGLRLIFNESLKNKELRFKVNIDLTISQFLYSYRAILQRAFSSQYSFTTIDKKEYVDYFIHSFILGHFKKK